MQQTNKNLKYFYFSLCPTIFCIDISRKKICSKDYFLIMEDLKKSISIFWWEK